jgi:hypothetical protein
MSRRSLRPAAASVLALCVVLASYSLRAVVFAGSVPSRLDDEEFWRIVTSFSERAGTFPSDNLLSNERSLQEIIPELTGRHADGVYVGVGPEQNFTYIAALKPQMAFIVDIRRGNMDLHLMYKALFELSADRAEFVSRLFSKKRPNGLGARSSITEIFDAYSDVEASETLYVENVRAVVNRLVKEHGFSLSADDTLRLQRAYRAFFTYGPAIQYSSTRTNGRRDEPTYRDLMLATDRMGLERSFLASEEGFTYLKRFESDNLLVPLIGNFVGPKALRSVAAYLADKGATVSTFYVSNVEEYLRRDGTWKAFCANAAALPLDEQSRFIRSVRGDAPGAGFRLESELGFIAADVKACDAN